MKKMLLVGVAALLVSGALAADDETIEKNVVVEVVGEEGENVRVIRIDADGEHEGREMIFVGEDGKVHEIKGGSGNHWVSAFGNGDFMFHAGMGRHAVLGVQLIELTPELRRHYGVAGDEGVMVSRVVDDSAASRAGIEVGDILIAVDGEKVASTHGVRHNLMDKEDGDVVLVDLFRNGRLMTVTADAEVREAPMMMQHRLELICDSDEECDSPHAIAFRNECEGSDECEVRVTCSDDGCSCVVNDADVECPDSMPHHRN